MSSPSPRSVPSLDVGLFNVLWGIGILLHFTWPGPDVYVKTLPGYLAVTAAALLIVRPRLSWVWGLAAATQIVEALHTAVTTERMSMSWLIVATLHVVFLVGLVRLRDRPAEQRSQAVLDAVTPALRWLVIAIYFYATLHKLNVDYFADGNGRPLRFMNRISPLLDASAFLTKSQAATLGVVTEGVIFALLLVPRTRIVAVALGIGLHGALGFAGFQQFAIMFPMLLLFLRSVPHPAPAVASRLAGAPTWLRPASLLLVPAAVAFLTWGETIARTATVRDTWWIALVGVASFEVGRRVRAHGLADVGDVPLFRMRPAHAVAPVLFAAWCFVPYLGITSHPCMTMYSELKVHSGITNHLFVPAGLQIDAIQGDFVEITESTSKRYPVGAHVPRLALRKALYTARLRGKAPRRVSWLEDGAERTARRGQLPSPSVLERLPMVSFNGPVALHHAKRQARKRR